MKKTVLYRTFIDHMVKVCQEGQGQIGARRVMKGIWNANATTDFIPEQHEMNMLLKKITMAERKTLSKILADEVVTGVFETLKALETFQVQPFESGYEASPFNDFIGRLDDWEWPE